VDVFKVTDEYAQAERLRALGWADYMKVEMARDRKSFVLSYWMFVPPSSLPPASDCSSRRPPPPTVPGRPAPPKKFPLLGGTLTFAISPVTLPPARTRPGIGPASRTPVERARARVQERGALALHPSATPGRVSDSIEALRLTSAWAPQERALGVPLARDALELPAGALAVDARDLDLGALLRRALRVHARAILGAFAVRLAETSAAFARRGAVRLMEERGEPVLRVRMCGAEAILVALDARTGRFALRDTGALSAAARGPRLSQLADRVNESPVQLLEVLGRLRLMVRR
jgi:mediator of RNA polymerase II transcription subunit 14